MAIWKRSFCLFVFRANNKTSLFSLLLEISSLEFFCFVCFYSVTSQQQMNIKE